MGVSFFPEEIETLLNWVGRDFFLDNLIGVKNSFLLCFIVSCREAEWKIFYDLNDSPWIIIFFTFQLRQWELELYHRKDRTQESKKLPASVHIWSRNHKATYKISVRVLYWEQEKRKSLQEPIWISVFAKVDSPRLKCSYEL